MAKAFPEFRAVLRAKAEDSRRQGRALDWDIPRRVAPQQSSLLLLPAPGILPDRSQIGVPLGVGFHHGVEDDHKLADAGDGHNLGGFGGPPLAPRCQAFRKALHRLIDAFGGQGGHVEHGANGTSAAKDRPQSLAWSTVTIEWGHADESGDLLPIQLPQLGKFGNERGGGLDADSRHRPQQRGLVFPVIVIIDHPRDLAIDRVDLLFQGREHRVNALLRGFGEGVLESILLLGLHVGQLPTALDKLLQLPQGAIRNCKMAELAHGSELGKDGGIDGIRFCFQAHGGSEVPNLTGIGARHPVTGLKELGHGDTLVTTGGFEHDRALVRRGELRQERGETDLVIADLEGLGIRAHRNLQCRLGDIDAHVRKVVHG